MFVKLLVIAFSMLLFIKIAKFLSIFVAICILMLAIVGTIIFIFTTIKDRIN